MPTTATGGSSNIETGTMIQIFAADAGHGDGVIPTLAVIDEPHRQDNMDLVSDLVGEAGQAGRAAAADLDGGRAGLGVRGDPRFDQVELATKVERKGAYARYEGPGIVMHEWALEEDADPDDMRAVKAGEPVQGDHAQVVEGEAGAADDDRRRTGGASRAICRPARQPRP